MATKKEKRERGLARHEQFLREEEERNRKILEAAQRRRAIELRDEWRPRHDEKHFKFVNECPLCQDVKREQAKKARSESAKKAVGKVAGART